MGHLLSFFRDLQSPYSWTIGSHLLKHDLETSPIISAKEFKSREIWHFSANRNDKSNPQRTQKKVGSYHSSKCQEIANGKKLNY